MCLEWIHAKCVVCFSFIRRWHQRDCGASLSVLNLLGLALKLCCLVIFSTWSDRKNILAYFWFYIALYIFHSSIFALEVKEDLRPRSTHCRALDVRVWQVIVSASGLVVATTQAVRAVRDSVRTFKASSEGKIRAAVAKAMKPFEPSRPQDEVIQRPVMETLRQRVECWRQHATIIGGRYQSGKSVATEEALRGVRGVVRFSIESADWKRMMFEELKVENSGLFKEMMRRVGEKLKDFPDNLTKYPVLLLDIPRTTIEGLSGQQFFSNIVMHLTRVILFRFLWARHRPSLFYSEGCGDGQNRLCHTCSPAERLSSNGSNRKRFAGTVVTSIYPWSKVIVSASSAAVALAFDAGGTERQEDIWVADLTEEETKEFLALHGHEKNWKDFVDACVSAQFNNMLID